MAMSARSPNLNPSGSDSSHTRTFNHLYFEPSSIGPTAATHVDTCIKPGSSEIKESKAILKQLQTIPPKLTEFKASLKKRLADPKTSKSLQTCLKQCRDDVNTSMSKAINCLNKRDVHSTNPQISGMSTDIMACHDCFTETGGPEDKEVQKFNDWFQGVIKDCLAKLMKP